MKVQRQVLKQYLAYRGLSYKELADRCRPRVAKSTIGHLVSGERTTCRPETARAIEKALDVAPGTIFIPRVLIGSPNDRQAA